METNATTPTQTVDGHDLKELRLTLGLTRTAMASLLYVSHVTYGRWEEGDTDSRMWSKNSARLSAFYAAAMSQLDEIRHQGVDVGTLISLPAAAATLGVPQEVLFARIRAGEMYGEDLGVLGLWARRTDVEQLGY